AGVVLPQSAEAERFAVGREKGPGPALAAAGRPLVERGGRDQAAAAADGVAKGGLVGGGFGAGVAHGTRGRAGPRGPQSPVQIDQLARTVGAVAHDRDANTRRDVVARGGRGGPGDDGRGLAGDLREVRFFKGEAAAHGQTVAPIQSRMTAGASRSEASGKKRPSAGGGVSTRSCCQVIG